jgi:hypothetical protein
MMMMMMMVIFYTALLLLKPLTSLCAAEGRYEMDFAITARILLPSVCIRVCVYVHDVFLCFYLETSVFDFRCNKHVSFNVLLAAVFTGNKNKPLIIDMCECLLSVELPDIKAGRKTC